MPYEISAREGGRCLAIKWTGVISPADIQAASVETIEQAKRSGLTKVIVDVTAITNRLSFTELFFSTESQSRLGPPRPRSAIVGRPDQAQELRFIENVGVNRGMPVRVFTAESEALTWLGE